ncbi:MAG: sugar transferase [Ramlibacter sp.]
MSEPDIQARWRLMLNEQQQQQLLSDVAAMGMSLKRATDVLGAALLLLILSSLLVLIAASIKVGSRGPVLFVQQRVGRGGKPFRIYKFRTMVAQGEDALAEALASSDNAAREWSVYQKLARDPRITRVGAVLRRWSLDELPQLWNVLVGDMSLVGPRPCMASQVHLHGLHFEDYCAMRPGITGLWQVSGRNRLTYQQRVSLDTAYVRNWSLLLDLIILLKTLREVLRGSL